MPITSSDQQLSRVAWQGLAIAAAYFLTVGIALHSRFRRAVRVIRYEPPEGISPTLACYLRERGVTEKPLAVAIVSMDVKGFLRLEQNAEDYLISRLNDAVILESEEQAVAEVLFRSSSTVLLKSLSPAQIALMIQDLHASLEGATEPNMISQHFAFLVPGLALSGWSLVAGLYAHLDQIGASSGLQLLLIPFFLTIVGILAIIKTFPATLFKVRTYMPGSHTPVRLPFTKQDLKLFYLLLMVVAFLGLMALMVSWSLALQLASFLAMNAIAALLFRTPTAQGYAVLDQLSDFRSFLVEVEADRINRVNQPGSSSSPADKAWAWALALGVEHCWGEEFCVALLNIVGFQAAYSEVEQSLPEEPGRDLEIIDLGLK